MPRGFFSQSLYVLFENAPSLETVQAALASEARRVEPTGEGWIGGGPSLLVPYRPEVNGQVVIDVFDAPFPDAMGHPETEPDTFGCWAMGGFGPAVFPGNLKRAAQQAARFFDDAEGIAEGHRGLVRLRITYVFGGGPDAKILPEDHDALGELSFLLACVEPLLALPSALAYFQPNGEVLLDAAGVEDALAGAAASELPPLDLHTSVRLWNVGDEDGWGLMDTVGMETLVRPDLEALFHFDHVDPNDVADFLRSVCLYLVARGGDVIGEGDEVDGPGGTWRFTWREEAAVAPPRKVLRLLPEDGPRPPV